MVSGGIGTNRTLSHETQNGSYRILCATSSGVCDAGIPIVCINDVYSKIQEPLIENSGIEVNIKGTLVELPFSIDQILVPARGIELNQTLKDWLSTALHIPRYFILVESSLQVKKYISDFHLRASAWTLFDREVDNGIIPSFTYATFNPGKSSSLEKASDFITKYVNDHSGVTIYTDFDEHVRRLESKYNIGDLMDRQYNSQTAENDLNTFLAWGRSVQDVLR